MARLSDRPGQSVAALAALLASVSLAAVATAQDVPLDGDAGAWAEDPTSLSQDDPNLPDTDYTPTGKPGDTWFQVAGARFADADDPAQAEGSRGITSYGDNLFDVAFRNENRGLVGGARCERSDPDAESGCTPVVYRFDASPEAGEVWTEVALPGGVGDAPENQRPGFVGAIAWIDSARALAVGGSGLYPRREPSYDPACQGGDLDPWNVRCDPAGDARAWLYEDGRWCELKVGAGDGSCPALPAGMRGLTAVDFKPDGSGLGFTGGLGQIHRWQAGRFDKRYDNTSPPTDLQQLNKPATRLPPERVLRADTDMATMRRMFRFRVRDIRFADTEQIHAFAVTSGCCSADDTADQAQLLAFNESQGGGRWYMSSAQRGDGGAASSFLLFHETTAPVEDPAEIVDSANEAALEPGIRDLPTPGVPSLREHGTPLPAPPATKTGMHQSGLDRIDSLYSIHPGRPTCPKCNPSVAVLATTASRDSLVEPRSTAACLTASGSGTRQPFGGVTVSPLGGTTRLHSIDGTTPSNGLCNAGPDWAAGEVRSRVAAGRGRQGVVLSTETAERSRPTPYHPVPAPEKVAEQGYKPPDEERVRASQASREELVPSYTLNSIDMVLETGQGWAVGDHGAIVRLDPDKAAEAVAKAEPESPGLTPGRGRALGAREAYDPLRPTLTAEPGQVPPLAARPVEQLDQPRMVSAGSPDANHAPTSRAEVEDVAEIVMSRDGSEGWAVGPSPVFDESGPALENENYGLMSLYRFDGAKWTRCDPRGVPRQLEPDAACAGALPLRRFLRPPEDTPVPVRLAAAARIPYERDDEPDNDDDFEVLAVGSDYRYPKSGLELPLLMRYKDDRWQLDEGLEDVLAVARHDLGGDVFAPTVRDVAFTAPDDGWVLASAGGNGRGSEWLLFHWDGEEWSRCGRGQGDCSGPRVPEIAAQGSLLGLQAAGDRVYLYGWRNPLVTDDTGATLQSMAASRMDRYPLIIYRERGEDSQWTDGSGEGGDGGGYDPYFDNPSPGEQGKVTSLSVAQRPDGTYTGWAVGRFFSYELPPDLTGGRAAGAGQHDQGIGGSLEPTALLLRLGDGDGGAGWRYFRDRGALYDFMSPTLLPSPNLRMQTEPQMQVTLPGSPEGDRAFIAQRDSANLFGFNPDRDRWDIEPSQRPPAGDRTHGWYQALAPDGHGGFWAAVKNTPEEVWSGGGQVHFFHYTDRPRRPVFREVPHPLGDAPEQLSALASGPDGTVWAATDQGRLARYDRMTGWEVTPIDGWDPGTVVTRRSEVFSVAVGPDGRGIAVGRNGRIANVSPAGVRIDPAASARCSDGGPPPCGTGYDLRAAAIAPDGSALAGGDGLTVLFRSEGGHFRRAASPPGNAGDRITGIAYPGPDRTGLDRAWLVSSAGYVYRGTRADERWKWVRENVDRDFDTIGRNGSPLRAVAIDADGHGYAVGDGGILLERVPVAAVPWRRLRAPGTDDLLSIALGPDGKGALVGGEGGLILTRVGDRFEFARPADYSRGVDKRKAASNANASGIPVPQVLPDARGEVGPVTGAIVGVAMVPGREPGEVEAWAASEARGTGTNRMFHFASGGGDPLLSPDARAEPLLDTPPRAPGELTFAAFGNTDCDLRSICTARRGSLKRHEVVGEQIVAELRRRFGEGGEAGFAVFTGDATFTAGLPASSVHKSDRVGSPGNWNYASGEPTTDPYGAPEMAYAPVMQRQWGRMVADRLEDDGVALFGAVGAGDLSRPIYHCDTTGCGAAAEEAKTGDNLTWRNSMSSRLAPWGSGSGGSGGGLSFERVEGVDRDATSVPDQSVEIDGDGPVPSVDVKVSARTHYAVDVKRDGRAVARVVVVDTSLRSLQQSDPIQQPLEQNGQLQWLERMICIEGSLATETCTRKADQAAVVVTNTPTYSYGQTAPTEINAADGVRLEQVLMRHRASVVVSGRLNWNARYWATAAGVHEPCPGAAYQDAPPSGGERICNREETDHAVGQVPDAPGGPEQLTSVLAGVKAPEPPADVDPDDAAGTVTGVLPFVVAAGGGGPLGTGHAPASPSDGYWHGYSVVRLDPSRDPRKVVVEQRPVFDWITMRPPANVLRPGQRMNLRGQGREPVGYGASVYTRFDPIDSAAITHRYDLVLADPQKPYVPLEDANGDYVPVPASVATVDRTTGAVRAGRGGTGRTYTVAILSVGDKAATWPIAFEPRRSFAPPRAKIALPPIPRAARAPAAQPPMRVADAPAPPPAQPPATPGSPLASQTLQPPQPPTVPSLPAAQAPPAPAPPTPPSAGAPPPPPAPPTPPAQPQPLPLSLNAKLQPISIVPSVNPPAPPPVNPAPPAGGAARKEAKQKQAAVAKSEEGEGGGDAAQADVNIGSDPSHGASRLDQGGQHAFTRLEQQRASALRQTAIYGGGTALMGLALALAWSIGRPGPRRRPPEVPAPAHAIMRGGRRR